MGRSPRRLARLAAVAVGGTLAVAGLLILPALVGLLPSSVRRYSVEWSACALLVSYVIARALAALPGRPGADESRPIPEVVRLARRALGRLDTIADWSLRLGLPLVLALFVAALLATWVPHYLTWPWCRDLDTFAVLAQSWDAGILPYRDILGYNFPGSIYLSWVVGKTFGWGRTAPLLAIDTAAVAMLGLALAAWSRRRLGGPLPGLGAYLAFLAFYLGLQYEQVAQRDWYTAWCIAMSLLALQSWPGRPGLLASALATATALTFRPHAVLFVPALASAIDEHARRPDEPPSKTFRALVEWSSALAVSLALAFAPLVISGIADDLLRGLRIASYGGPYSRATPESVGVAFAKQFDVAPTDILLASTLALALVGPTDRRRMARTWSLAWLGALIYGPIHPVPHAYLAHPSMLVRAISVALPIGWLLDLRPLPKPLRLLAVAILLYELMPTIPRQCSAVDSFRALGPLVRGEEPSIPPLGSLQAYQRAQKPPTTWDDYRATLRYLREATGPSTMVANALNRYPYDSLNGPTGRLSPFRAESGLCWMIFVRIDLDGTFADELERTPDSVVVWDPLQRQVDPHLPYPRLLATIRRLYEPDARFGRIEVWRRKARPFTESLVEEVSRPLSPPTKGAIEEGPLDPGLPSFGEPMLRARDP